MNEIIKEHTLRALTVQRNIFLVFVILLLLITLILSFLLTWKNERIVIVPATLDKEVWLEGSMVSPSYLEQMGCFIGDLLLTRSPASSDMQLTILMRHVDPIFATVLNGKLMSELNKLKKDNASYVFYRTKVIVDPKVLSVSLEGERTLLLGEKVLSNTKEIYRLGFKSFGGQLLLSSIERGDEKR